MKQVRRVAPKREVSSIERRWILERNEQAVLRDAEAWLAAREDTVSVIVRRAATDTLTGSILRLRRSRTKSPAGRSRK